MTILEELKVFIKYILNFIYLFFGFSFFFFIFPSGNSFSIQFFNMVQRELLPQGVRLIVTNPLSAFISQISVSLLLAFIITLPFLLYGTMKYLTPALFPSEKKMILKSLIPSMVLFFGGCIFAYYLLIPSTFKLLYPYTEAIGAVPFFGLDEFISSVFGLMLATGIMFLLPVFMIFLSFIGIISPAFWIQKWRYALFFFLVFSAVVTPDGTGITMILLFVPMAGLYLAGSFLTARFEKSKISV